MKAIVATQASPSAEKLNVELIERPRPEPAVGQCLVEVYGASVNASDVKGLMGTMPRLVWPRTPGRDYAGRVVAGPDGAGPNGTVGREVWGSGADLGMSRDGAHAEFLLVDIASLHDKPANLSMLEAAGIGVPFCTAWIGLVDYAAVEPGETVAVMGLNGKVGQAVTQIATMMGAKVIGVERSRGNYLGHANASVDVINASEETDIVAALKDRTGGAGPDIVFNTVGEPYFQIANSALRLRGRHVVINALEKTTPLDLSEFYRRRLQLFGMASMGFDAVALGDTLEKLRPHFESEALQPYSVDDAVVLSLETATEGYRKMLAGNTRSRVLINPKI